MVNPEAKQKPNEVISNPDETGENPANGTSVTKKMGKHRDKKHESSGRSKSLVRLSMTKHRKTKMTPTMERV